MKQPVPLELLRSVPLFATVPRDAYPAIAEAAELLEFARNSIIIHEEEESGRGFYIILGGEAKVVVSGPDGREAVLALLCEGDFFGEMSLLDGDPRSATVKASADCELLSIRRDPFIDLLRKFPEIAISMLAELSLRLRNANKHISSLALKPVHERVADVIFQLAEMRGVRAKGQTIIRDRPTQQEIADMASTTRETVSRVLGALQRDGIIATDGRDLVILDEERLRRGS